MRCDIEMRRGVQLDTIARREASDPQGPTGALATWLASVDGTAVPGPVRDRTKYLLLDGIGCLLVGSRLDWSALAVQAITEFEDGGTTLIAGWNRRASAFSAAMLNSSFIQGFELDDYFPDAPIHLNSTLVPAMLPVIEKRGSLTGGDFLLALTLGYEVASRVGLALHGPQMLSRGWHSGVVFGGAGAAAAAGRLLGLHAAGFEDAIGIACTQACGLMCVQFESMVKRMQHGFAARNGLYGAVLAARDYIGPKRVFEREYGGFLPVFGEGHNPDDKQIALGLGSIWHTSEIAVKPYAAMAGIHAAIDAALAIRGRAGEQASEIQAVEITVGSAAFSKGGHAIHRPVEPITAQFSLAYSVAVALIDGKAMLEQFSKSRVNAEDVWELIGKTKVSEDAGWDTGGAAVYRTHVSVTLGNGSKAEELVETPLGGRDRPLSGADIEDKFFSLMDGVTDRDRSEKIRDLVLNLDRVTDLKPLLDLLRAPVRNALS